MTIKKTHSTALEFYDLKTQTRFTTDTYDLRHKGKGVFAVAQSPNGPHECWKTLSKALATELEADGSKGA